MKQEVGALWIDGVFYTLKIKIMIEVSHYKGFIISKYGLYIKVSEIVCFSYDEAYKQTNITCSKDCVFMVSDMDKSFFNLLLQLL